MEALKPPWVSKELEPCAGDAYGRRPEAYPSPLGELRAPVGSVAGHVSGHSRRGEGTPGNGSRSGIVG